MTNNIQVPLHGPPISSAAIFLAKPSVSQPESKEEDSDLLKSIRLALRGSGTDVVSTMHTTISATTETPWGEEELTWNAHTVVISAGGIMRKKWSFEEEGQPIQWACTGWLEQSSLTSPVSAHSAAYYTSDSPDLPPAEDPSQRPTFGPFTRARHEKNRGSEQEYRVPAVFVFLRSIGKIFLKNGLDYTFSLPFIVRKAWPLYPHGVMIQRVLESSEFEESEVTGDPVLPTIFSVTSPFSEAGTVGLTDGIIGGFSPNLPAYLKDEDENSTKPLKSVSPTEMVLWVSPTVNDEEVLVTLDIENRRLTVWRYVYIKPKDIPVPLGRNRARNSLRKRLSTATTTASLVTHGPPSMTQWSLKSRRNSLTRNDLSVTMDRMVLGGRAETDPLAPIEHGRMKAAYWMERLHSQDILAVDADSWRTISVALFDHRWDGIANRLLMAICLPATQVVHYFSLNQAKDNMLKVVYLQEGSGVSLAPINSTRENVQDLLVVDPDGWISLATHGLYWLKIDFEREISTDAQNNDMEIDGSIWRSPIYKHGGVVSVQDAVLSSVTLRFGDGRIARTTINLVPNDPLTRKSLQVLALTMPPEFFFLVHRYFLEKWSLHRLRTSDGVEFDCFAEALYKIFDLPGGEDKPPSSAPYGKSWNDLSESSSHFRFCDDPVLKHLHIPPPLKKIAYPRHPNKPHKSLAPVLYALHLLGEDLRLMVHCYSSLLKLAPVICRLALVIRPEWADYWKRLCPGAMPDWPSPTTTAPEFLDDRIPVWPPDASAILYGRISNPDWKVPDQDVVHLITRFRTIPSLAYGRVDPLANLHHLTSLYMYLADNKTESSQKRAENAVHNLVVSQMGSQFINRLPLGIAAPLREAARTCQLSPPGDWPLAAYRSIGRNDLAACASDAPDMLFNDGYRAVKDHINPSRPRRTISEIIAETRASAGEVDAVSGVELDLEEFTDIRFSQDRRLEEVARMLCSSTVPLVRLMEHPELNEHDQAKEQQHQVLRIAERTLALPYGRAMFTFGSVPTVTREAYVIPKLEYAVRLQPLNITAAPEPGKILQEYFNWGEFHNGVAAGLRISPTARGVESSWIAFNKPSELTPEHAGFLFGLGLTGHLKEMLTWHTFGYLTPKHDLTSIGVLLGLSAANVGSGNRHVTKLLAVHTPALLPTPTIDLNVSLMTQAAGLAGVGLLYMGTKHRRMAEVCLNQIIRKDLVQPDLSNEHREAYTYSAALAFGMIMLGKGSSIPADMALLSRLAILVHGDTNSLLDKKTRPAFDINLTSPAATIALGLMYLRTECQDVADVLTIPDTVLALNRIQPSFLLLRTLARSLIMWDLIKPTTEWLATQVPPAIAHAMEGRFQGKSVDDALELAYYNIVAGCCFVVGLKYAGTARQEAWLMVTSYFELFRRLAYSAGPAFDHKIKRSAVREGLNLISISLSMILAGTGEITTFRQLRYAYGTNHQAMRYGIHVATHMSLGLLFLGGGRFTLGTSDAAIACMVAAFFPRFHHVPSDNKSYLQALRHLWVLAVEPRCLVARDVDTTEVVYLPVKISMKEGNEVETTQLICPTLIPNLDNLLSIRVDTPRYWPFYLDTENIPRHKDGLLRSQTLYVKRRTAFLSYTEDPRGSRSLFARSGSSTGDAATLDFPQLTDTKIHPAGDLSQFISSFSNDVLFLAFAHHFCREVGETVHERLFHNYCHASLLDSILQDKPQTLQSHLTLYMYRNMSPSSRYFHLRLQDLRFAADFYSKIYDRRFSGRLESNGRPPLIRETTVSGTLHALDQRLNVIRVNPQFLDGLGQYARGEVVLDDSSPNISERLAWYLLRNGVPVSTLLLILKDLARDAHSQCLGTDPPEGTSDPKALDQGIREVLHGTGTKMTTALGSGWSVRSLDEIIAKWT